MPDTTKPEPGDAYNLPLPAENADPTGREDVIPDGAGSDPSDTGDPSEPK